MATAKQQYKNPRCEIHGTPTIITIPIKTMGNIDGEEWYCKECGKTPEVITHQI